jgi:hypothetical protein
VRLRYLFKRALGAGARGIGLLLAACAGVPERPLAELPATVGGPLTAPTVSLAPAPPVPPTPRVPPAPPVPSTSPDAAMPDIEPAAPKPRFADATTVSYAELIAEIRAVADELASAPEVERAYRKLLAEFSLTESELGLRSFSRVRLVFEATRDGGLWGVKWAITDRLPRSDAIWAQLRALDLSAREPEVAAIAECDELSAWFSALARDVGVEGFVGLHWPTWNHTVAVWQIERASPNRKSSPLRILVPTSQVWLSREASLGTREFKTDRVVFPYARKDLKDDAELPADLARFLVRRLVRWGGLSNEALLERRNALGGS